MTTLDTTPRAGGDHGHAGPGSEAASGGGPGRDEGTAATSEWVKVDPGGLEVGRLTTVVAAGRAICLARTEAGYGALDNHCPHQGGPLGDGQIENGYVICPWHAYEYDPVSGQPPPGFKDGATSLAVDERPDGVYVRLPLRRRSRASWTRWST